jgi:hypothetical protein
LSIFDGVKNAFLSKGPVYKCDAGYFQIPGSGLAGNCSRRSLFDSAPLIEGVFYYMREPLDGGPSRYLLFCSEACKHDYVVAANQQIK